MKKHVSRLDLERANSYVIGFVEGLNVTKEITLQKLREAINTKKIVILKGENVIFDMIESIGSIDQ